VEGAPGGERGLVAAAQNQLELARHAGLEFFRVGRDQVLVQVEAPVWRPGRFMVRPKNGRRRRGRRTNEVADRRFSQKNRELCFAEQGKSAREQGLFGTETGHVR
jgi:hypothetical protein